MRTRHCLAVTDCFDPEEYIFASMHGDESDTLAVENLRLLTTFSNMDDAEIKQLKDCCSNTSFNANIDAYVKSVIESITKHLGESAANVLTLELLNNYHLSDDDSPEYKAIRIDDAIEILHKTIDAAVVWARAQCDILSEFFDSDSENQLKLSSILVSAIPPDIRFIPLAAISKKTQRITYCNAYYVSSVRDFFLLMAIFTIRDDKPLRRCKNCDKYFIPISKRDEIYCLNCRAVSYDTKIKENEILSSYRKIYKTQSARKARNMHRPQISERFESWKHRATSKRNECIAGTITLEEMNAAISSADWLERNGG